MLFLLACFLYNVCDACHLIKRDPPGEGPHPHLDNIVTARDVTIDHGERTIYRLLFTSIRLRSASYTANELLRVCSLR